LAHPYQLDGAALGAWRWQRKLDLIKDIVRA